MGVVVVDDCSGGRGVARLARIPGLRMLTTPRNLGFIGACNHAAGFARGDFLLFLNNDTEVRAGWLDTLVTLLAHDAAPRAAPESSRPKIDVTLAARHPLRILLAEDNVVTQNLALPLLQQLASPPHRARSAPQPHPSTPGRHSHPACVYAREN